MPGKSVVVPGRMVGAREDGSCAREDGSCTREDGRCQGGW